MLCTQNAGCKLSILAYEDGVVGAHVVGCVWVYIKVGVWSAFPAYSGPAPGPAIGAHSSFSPCARPKGIIRQRRDGCL